MTKAGRRPITLPMHKGRDCSRGLEQAISLYLHDDPDAAAVEGSEAVHQAVEIGELKMRVTAAASS